LQEHLYLAEIFLHLKHLAIGFPHLGQGKTTPCLPISFPHDEHFIFQVCKVDL